MAYVVKEYDYRYGGVVEETYFHQPRNVFNKVKEIMEKAFERYEDDFDEYLEEYNGNVEEFISDVYNHGEFEGLLYWEEIEFEDEEKKL